MNNQDCEIEFLNSPANYDCKCPICLETFFKKVIHQTACCGHHICLQCSTQLKQEKRGCPQCRTQKLVTSEDKFFTRQMLSLEIRCYYSNAGCKWTGELRHLNEHIEKNCKRGYVPCPCCYKPCHINDHLPICPEAISCPNCCPNATQRRDAIKAHLENECPLRIIIPSNGALPIAADGAIRVAPLSFTMTDYLKHLKNGQSWYGPPFYTHQRGYKLIIKFHPTMHNLSIYAYVMKGKYDDQLQWPLHAEVEITTFGFEQGAKITKKLYLPADKCCKQVRSGTIALLGTGNTKFAKDERLNYIHYKNLQKLSCDCLSFRVEKIRMLPNAPMFPAWTRENCVDYFVLSSFSRNKRKECSEFYGSSIYTDGYLIDLIIQISPNDCGDGTGADVLISAEIEKNNCTRNSIWPFNGELGIKLMNLREDANHKTVIIKFNNENSHPTNARSSETLRFTNHSQLLPSLYTQYLYNEYLVFKVAYVVAYSTPCSLNAPIWMQRATRSNALLGFALNKASTRVALQNFYYSKPFFASGYKMQISINTDIDGYIGVYAVLMKGPNDDKLIWPFCGDVVVELVNWIEDIYHHSYVIKLSPEAVTNSSCNRVLVGDESKGWGTSQFIQHSALQLKFLQNDCLYFRVKEVVVYSKYLSLMIPKWKKPQSLSPFAECTVTDISKRKKYNTKFYSPAFYCRGYKLRLEVGRAPDQQHIGIYARLLRGECDDNLIWPFQASIVLELVNWREDANHHSYNISFNRNTPIEAKSQVTTGVEAPTSWGTHNFISYSYLGNAASTKYLQDDCLRFKVKEVVVYSTPLSVMKPLYLEEADNLFTITHFSNRVQLQDTYQSPPFYANGYKMCFRVFPAGNGTGKGTHVSIYGYLMKGDYDAELNWPFTADVVVDILNWRGDHNHHRVILPFNESCTSNEARARVHNNQLAKYGLGNPKAIEVTTLFPTHTSSDSQYLYKDCMCIEVHDIVVYSNDLMNKSPYWEGWWHKPSKWQTEFTITRVSQHMKYNTPYISPPFYSYKNGYKLRLEVYLNGQGDGTGTHVSFFIRLLKGEHDRSLWLREMWPMDINLLVKIFNWCKNGSHIVKSVRVSKSVNDDCMPITSTNGRATIVRGFTQFCTHSTLLTNGKATQYVQDDCMRVRIGISQNRKHCLVV